MKSDLSICHCVSQTSNEGSDAMKDATIKLNQEEEFPIHDVCDEALESAGFASADRAGNFTLGACTGLSVCDG